MRTDPVGTKDPVEIERSAPAEIAPVLSSRDEIRPLTGLRFWAAFWVVTAHFQPVLETLWPAARAFAPISWDGNMGVDLFFILSGFILIYNYRETFARMSPRRYVQFLGLRLARIYPVHLFTLGLFALFVVADQLAGPPAVRQRGVFTLYDFWEQLLLIQAWAGDPYSWNQPSWSLSAEWFAYLLFPFLAWAIFRFGSVKALVGTILIGVPAAWLTIEYVAAPPLFPPLLRIGVTFTMGCFLGIVFLNGVGAGRKGWGAIAGATAVAIIAASQILPDTCCAEYATVIPLMALLIFSLGRAVGRPASWLGTDRAMFWGGASYALYMTHWFVLAVGAVLLPADSFATSSLLVRSLLVLVYLAAFFGAAALTFVLVERPARRRIRDALAAG